MEAKSVPAPQPRPRAMAEPLHIQRLEAALNMRPFMNMAKRSLRKPLSSDEETDDEHVVKREQDVQDSDDSSTVGVVRMKQSRKRKCRLLASKEGKLVSGAA